MHARHTAQRAQCTMKNEFCSLRLRSMAAHIERQKHARTTQMDALAVCFSHGLQHRHRQPAPLKMRANDARLLWPNDWKMELCTNTMRADAICYVKHQMECDQFEFLCDIYLCACCWRKREYVFLVRRISFVWWPSERCTLYSHRTAHCPKGHSIIHMYKFAWNMLIEFSGVFLFRPQLRHAHSNTHTRAHTHEHIQAHIKNGIY